MCKVDHKNPNEPIFSLFYGEKTAENGWYIETETNEKSWDTEKVTHFWEMLRQEKMTKKDYNFSMFIFPEFSKDHFWLENKSSVFEGKVDFSETQFMSEAIFFEVRFDEEVNFNRARFKGKADFLWASFNEMAYFRSVNFDSIADFHMANFFGKVDFESTCFAGEAYFNAASFENGVHFNRTSFSGIADFSSIDFDEKVSFLSANFEGNAYFLSTSFTGDTDFHSTNFTQELFFDTLYCLKGATILFFNTKFSRTKQAYFKNLHIEGSLRFEQLMFSKGVTFLNCNFAQVLFVKSDITNATVSNCTFPQKKWNPRIVLANESATTTVLEALKETKEHYLEGVASAKSRYQGKLIWEAKKTEPNALEIKKPITLWKKESKKLIFATPDKTSNRSLKREHYEMMAETYRQLKTNQKNNNNWAMAGDAYRSEMVMRKKSIWQQFLTTPKKFWLLFSLGIMQLYDGLSGFQQSMARPLIWFLLIWLTFALGYYGYLQNISCEGFWSCLAAKFSLPFQQTDWTKSMQDSFYALFPLSGRLDGPLKFWQVLERIVGVILITFFVLSTRARLKQ
ncbi:MAG: pentapeptide repeat-containing protein [Bacteroidota bacterium]